MKKSRTPRIVSRLLHRKRLSSYLALWGIALTILGTAVALAIHQERNAWIAAIALGSLTFFSTAWGMAIELEEEMSAMADKLGDVTECIYLGNAAEVAITFDQRAREAESVRNTFVAFGISNENGAFQHYTSLLQVNKREELVKTVARQGAGTDIFSEEALSLGSSALKTLAKRMEDAYPTYEARYLREQYPIVNFMLLDYGKKRDREVLFGWGFHPQDKVGDVFISRDRDLYQLFALYWQTLREDSLPVSSFEHTAVGIHDIAGLWFDVAHEVPQTSNAQDELEQPKNETVKDLALIEISIADNRHVVVEGWRYDPTTYALKGSFHSKAAELHDHKLWFVADSCGSLSAGFYTFIHERLGSEPENKIKRNEISTEVKEFYGGFKGFAAESNSSTIEIHGKKIEDHRKFPDDPLEVDLLLRKHSKTFDHTRRVRTGGSPAAVTPGSPSNPGPAPRAVAK
jgi:hypothetical protein